MQQLSFTIPYTSSAIRATVVALNQMDNDLNGTVGLFVEPTRVVESPSEGFIAMATATEADLPTSIKPSGVEYAGIPTPPYVASDVPTPPVEDEKWDEAIPGEGAVDSAGMLWDARIHSSSKAFLKSDGTWKLKKGVDKTILAQVQAELMGNAQAPAVQAQESVDTSPTQSSVSTPLPPVEAIVETVVPTPPSDVPNPNAFRQLLSEITKAGLAPDYVQKTCREVNGCTLPECKDDMDKLAMLRMSLGL